MKKLNVKNFLNEMSYDLRLSELEQCLLKYQDIIVEYFSKNMFKYKERRTMHELMDIIGSSRVIEALNHLVYEEDMNTDLAYCLLTSTYNADEDLKYEAMKIAYMLQYAHFSEDIKDQKVLEIISYLGGWAIKGYETSSFSRVKSVSMILEAMPSTFAGAFGKINTKKLEPQFICGLFKKMIPDLTFSELVTGFSKTEMKFNSELEKQYCLRLQVFLCQLVSCMNDKKVQEAIERGFDDILRYNKNHYDTMKLKNMYMNYDFIEKLATGKTATKSRSDAAKGVKELYFILRKIKNDDKYYSLFF